ncbi:MAG TPA: acyl carrier protein [Acidimicrobiia bacterium]|jgi:acyl carrier protein
MAITPPTFDELAEYIATMIEIEPSAITPESLLVEDLGMDSLQMFELLVIADGYGLEAPEEDWLDITTFGDLHRAVSRAVETLVAS